MTTWILTCLFWLGVVFVPIGLALILIPERVMAWGERLNRWISTKPFFDALDQPRLQEPYFYKHHRVFGAIIIVLSVINIYMLIFYMGLEDTLLWLVKLAESVFGKWLLETCYYLLVALCVLALVAGAIIFVRPSLLKTLEAWGNRWVDTQKPLQRFDEVHEIPLSVLPGKPRIFGLLLLFAAAYIIFVTGSRIF